jgi:DNA-binding response OmpR family regulator
MKDGSPMTDAMHDACRKVLIVEDGPALAAGLHRVLEQGGYQVEHLNDRCRGVMMGACAHYAAILVDAALLDIGHGFLLDALRRDAAPIVILDGEGAEADGAEPPEDLLALVNSVALAA